jgi:hypothetical protein
MKIERIVILEAAVLGVILYINTTSSFAADNIQARTYYVVATNGNDAKDGTTPQTAFRTIQHAADIVQPGDRVIVKAGVYNEFIQIRYSGTESQKIIFEGERGPNGEYLSIIDPSVRITGWVRDEEMGFGVYSNTDVGFEPYAMVVERDGDTFDIPRLGHWGDIYDGFQYLAYPPDQLAIYKIESLNTGYDVYYWDGIEALYGYTNNTAYLRFRDGENPNNMMIKAAPSGGAIYFNDKDNVVIRNFKIRGAQTGVELTNNSGNNIIEENEIINGQKRILLEDGASNNHIRNNRMHMNGLSDFTPGTWQWEYHGEDIYRYLIRRHFYAVYKYEVGRGTSSPQDDGGIWIDGAGSNNEIYGNDIFNTLCAVYIRNTNDVKIYNNNLSNTSSFAIAFDYTVMDLEIYNNLFFECSGIRPHELTDGNKRAYIYKNIFYNKENMGYDIFFYWSSSKPMNADTPEIYLYHNTFAGGYTALMLNDTNVAVAKGGLPNVLFVNNVISTQRAMNYGETFFVDPDMVGGFDYNWIGTDYSLIDVPAWAGTNNIYTDGIIWPSSGITDFSLSENSEAIDAGIDLSQSFTIKDKTYDPLPGMEPGYYSGSAPDIGACEYNQGSPEPVTYTTSQPRQEQ